ncbi:hypothetical protein BKP57_06215 [Virgibacillus sp. 6R]|nr:hypothetical protein BKP57_06215 [Virgibacillus sp. 6R]
MVILKKLNLLTRAFFKNLLPQNFSLEDKINKVSIGYYVENQDIIERLENHINKRIVVYAQCKFQKKTSFIPPNNRKNESITFYYHNVKGNIYDENQILLIDD